MISSHQITAATGFIKREVIAFDTNLLNMIVTDNPIFNTSQRKQLTQHLSNAYFRAIWEEEVHLHPKLQFEIMDSSIWETNSAENTKEIYDRVS